MLSREEKEKEAAQIRAGWVPERMMLAQEDVWSPITILSPDGQQQRPLDVSVQELQRRRFGVADFTPISYRIDSGMGYFAVTDKRRVR